MREKVITITDEIGELLDLQTELFHKRTFQELSPNASGRIPHTAGRIRQLCSEPSDLPFLERPYSDLDLENKILKKDCNL